MSAASGTIVRLGLGGVTRIQQAVRQQQPGRELLGRVPENLAEVGGGPVETPRPQEGPAALETDLFPVGLELDQAGVSVLGLGPAPATGQARGEGLEGFDVIGPFLQQPLQGLLGQGELVRRIE